MDLIVNSKLVITSKELKWRFSKTSGPGGQNVNKNDTRVELIFNLKDSKIISPFFKKRLLENLSQKLRNGFLIIIANDKRSQFQNRQLALKRMAEILREGLKFSRKLRKQTKPTKAAQIRRIEQKKYRGVIKAKPSKQV